MAWTEEMVKNLKKMWKDGMTTGEIGKKLGVSKNSVVGKVHRLNLEGRPSPIKKKTVETKAPLATPAKTNKPEAQAPKAPSAAAKADTKAKTIEKANFLQEREMASPIICGAHPVSKDGKVTLTNLDNHTCRWPIGDPKDEGFHFCGKKVRVGQTYCDEHSAIAYVKASKK